MTTLGIDFGTSNSCAAVSNGAQEVKIVRFGEYDEMLPSCVLIESKTKHSVGRQAELQARSNPSSFRDNLKRDLLLDKPIHLRKSKFQPFQLVGMVLDTIVKNASRAAASFDRVVITFPATYTARELNLMREAAARARIKEPVFLEEPVAAAEYYAARQQLSLQAGQVALVYDFGGGTFDATLIEKTADGYIFPAAPMGLRDCGGRDIDHALFAAVLAGEDDTVRHDTLLGQTVPDLRRRYELLDLCRKDLKHLFSDPACRKVEVPLPRGFTQDTFRLTRAQFDKLIDPLLSRTIACCEDLLRGAGKQPRDLAAVLLVGGSSNLAAVSDRVGKAFARPVHKLDPQLAVCLGAALRRVERSADDLFAEAREKLAVGDLPATTALLRSAAEAGSLDAIGLLGEHYFEGIGVEKNHAEAARWLRRGAEAGHPESIGSLGALYYEGWGVPQDESEAIEYWKRGAAAGDAGSMLGMASACESGRGVDQDEAAAARWYRKAAELGNATAMARLAVCYRDGTGVTPDHDEAVRWMRQAAEAGDMIGALGLGVMYLDGVLVPQNYEYARILLTKAAEAGIPEASANLGAMHLHGLGVEQNPTDAVKWFRKAADAGNIEAMGLLGEGLRNGVGVKKDPVLALKWLRKAAAAGSPEAMHSIGDIYREGEGVRKDDAESVRWFRQAADAGHSDSMNAMGTMFHHGRGVPESASEAFAWWRKAADAGNATGMYNVGCAFEEGVGVKKDDAAAKVWFKKAADAGFAAASEKLRPKGFWERLFS